MAIINTSKPTPSLTNESTPFGASWDDPRYAWDDSSIAWDENSSQITNSSRVSSTVLNFNKPS